MAITKANENDDTGVHYAPLYNKGLSNHLPMFVRAQRLLGIPENIIKKRGQTYLASVPLRNLEDSDIVPNDNEINYLDRYNYYRQQLGDNDRTHVVIKLINKLEANLDAYLFHGMIRLAFALNDTDTDELSKALSFWETAEITDSSVPSGKPTEDMKESWNQLMTRRTKIPITFGTKDTMEKVKLVVGIPELMEKITLLSGEDHMERRIAYILGIWYLKTRDFYVLHVINGFNALVQLKPYINDFEHWLESFWIKAQVYCLITDERLPIIKMTANPWEQIMNELSAVSDIHDIKLFYSCRELNKRYDLKIYNKIAHILTHKYWGH